jgi:Secretion system C-terminal sorting domain
MDLIKKTLALSLVLASFGGFAQTSITQDISTDNGKLKIHVEKEVNGKKEVFDKTYDVENMSQEEKQALIDHVTDSLTAGSGKNMKMRVKVDRNNNDDRISKNYNYKNGKKKITINKDGKTIEKSIDRDENKGNNEDIDIEIDGDMDFDFDMKGMDFDMKDFQNKMGDMGKTLQFKFDELGPKMKKFGEDLEPEMRKFRNEFGPKMERFGRDMEQNFRKFGDGNNFKFEGGNSSKTVKSLNAYPNMPNNKKLNVEFSTPEKGNVTITVTDLNGKEIGKEKLADFTGEYLGQIELKGNPKGTIFVTVVQGEDGTVKRVVLK